MNKFLTALINDKAKLFSIICIILTIASSIGCGIISNSIVITIIYATITGILSACEIIYPDAILKKLINLLMNVNKKIILCFFIVIALLPVIIGFFTKEIIFEGMADFVEKMFSNPVPNCLGVLIVYSLIKHISKFSNIETIYLIIKSKNHFCDVVLQFGFIVSFLNAINYNINDEFKWTNFFNSIHLFVIVFCGVILTYIFALRLISKQPFEFDVKKIYPTSTLIWVWLFLVSCGFSPIIWGNAKHEVILLAFITVMALIVIWFIFYLIKDKALKNADEYQYAPPIFLSTLIIINLFINIFLGGDGNNKKMQFISGFFVLLIICVLIFSIFVNEKDET